MNACWKVLSVSVRPEFGQAKFSYHRSHEAIYICILHLWNGKGWPESSGLSLPCLLPVVCKDGDSKDWPALAKVLIEIFYKFFVVTCSMMSI